MSTQPKLGKANGTSIERTLLTLFSTVKRRLDFTSAPVAELKHRMLDALIQASAAKCVEFNLLANRTDQRAGPAFVLLSSLRGICEDLIYLTFLSRLGHKEASELVFLLLGQHVSRGLAAQQDFFAANNPAQPVLKGGKTTADAKKSATHARDELRKFWVSIGSAKPTGPTVRDMASEVGLSSTYEYIYFASSNFVHFNPQALLRTGWAENKDEPFKFSIRNIDTYYRRFSSFYGAVLFIGFHASFGENHFKVNLDAQIVRLAEIIGHIQRWPEIITFEEMNERPPSYFLTHFVGKAMREQDPTIPYGSILQEVRALKRVSVEP
jgi:hypothetical protein